MKLDEVKAPTQTVADAIRKVFAEALGPNGSRLEVIHEIWRDSVQFEIEYDFPEHLPKGIDLKKAGQPHILKAAISKGEMWKEGVFGAAFEITLASNIDDAEAKSLITELKKQYR